MFKRLSRKKMASSAIRRWAIERRERSENSLEEMVVAAIYAATSLGADENRATPEPGRRLSGNGSAFEICTFECFFLDYYFFTKKLDRDIPEYVMTRVASLLQDVGGIPEAGSLFDRRIDRYGQAMRESGLEAAVKMLTNNLLHTLDNSPPCRKEPVPIMIIGLTSAVEVQLYVAHFVTEVLGTCNDNFARIMGSDKT